MARSKSGLDYFSFDIDFFNDQKIEFVSAKYGELGELIAIKLLCKIYREGYYLKWGEDECLLFSKKAGEDISKELVKNVIDELLKRGFFNKNLYDKYSILTSKGIQKRFLEAAKRRKEIVFFKEYFLLNGHDVYISPQNVNIITKNVDIREQSKVKESKVKKSKEIKELVNTPFNQSQEPEKKKASNIEYDWDNHYWIGIADDQFESWQKKFPDLSVAMIINDAMITEFKKDPKKYREQAEGYYKGNYQFMIYDWLERRMKWKVEEELKGEGGKIT